MSALASLLNKVRDALEADAPRLEEAIDHTVAAWRLCRQPELADLVDALCLRRARELEKEREGQSYRTFAPVDARFRCARAIDASFAVVYGTLDHGYAYPDGKLANRDDPRLAQSLARVLFEKRFLYAYGQTEDFVDRYLKVLVELGDVRQVAPMRAVLESANAFPTPAHEAFARARYEAAVLALEQRATKLADFPDDARAAKDALLRALAPELAKRSQAKVAPRFQSKSAAEVLSAVFANPEDLSLRQVCGDRLSELGDPRGEYIALVFASAAGPLPPKSQKRMDALYHKNAGHWAGALAPITTREGMAFESGFVSELSLDKSSLGLTREMWNAALVADEWATVHSLHVSERAPDWWLQAFLGSPRSHRLRRLVFRDRVYDPKKAKPLAILERPEGASAGDPWRLTLAKPFAPKIEKVLRGFDAPQLTLLLEDAKRLGAGAAKIEAALQKLLEPPRAKRAKKPGPREVRRGANGS